MSDFPTLVKPIRRGTTITPVSLCSIGGALASESITINLTAVIWTANLAYYYPFILYEYETVYKVWWENAGAISGNVDAGVYNERGERLVSTGGVAQSGASSIQISNVTDTPLAPGCYYFAFVIDNTTARIRMTDAPSPRVLRAAGVRSQASAYPLPATATFANPTVSHVPRAGIFLNANIG